MERKKDHTRTIKEGRERGRERGRKRGKETRRKG